MAGTTDPPRAPLQLLPFELLSRIFKREELTKDDIKKMRLVARGFQRAANDILFGSIQISRLWKDRDRFEQICNAPNIAKCVREVVWDEIGWDQTLFPELSRPMSGKIPLWPHALTTVQRALLDIKSKEMFWFPVADPTSLFFRRTVDSDVADRRKLAVDTFGLIFKACIDRLTNLHTFTSRPIDPKRLDRSLTPVPTDRTIRRMRRNRVPLLTFPWGEWRKGLECRLFDELENSYTTKHRDGQAKLPRNDGLFMFLLPAMDRPRSRVRHLNWGDEYPGFSHVRSLPPESLKQLESLDACFLVDHASCRSTLTAGANHNSLIKALAHAANLQRIRLCCHHDRPWLLSYQKLGVCPIERSVAEALSQVSPPLRALHLSGLHATRANIMNWISVINKHTATLREVVIEIKKRSMPRKKKSQKRLWEDLNALPGWQRTVEGQSGIFREHRSCILDRCTITPKTGEYMPYKITMTKENP